MTVDFHAHLAPHDPAAPPFLSHLFDVEAYLELQADAGIELTVLSFALADLEGTEAELEEAKVQHAFLADLVSRHPDRFTALATVDPFGGEAWLAEADRALGSGFSGLCFPTSRRSRYLDSAEAEDAFAFANDRGTAVFLHPSDSPIEVERSGDAILRDWIGRPYDTGICLCRLLLADTLSRYPNVRLIAAHTGGPLPMLIGRLDSVHETFKRRAGFAFGGPPGGGPPGGGPPGGGPPGGGPPGGGPPGGGFPGGAVSAEAALKPAVDDPPPSARIGQLYLDTASYHRSSVQAAIDLVGADRVIVGTDYPPAGRSPKPTVDLVRGLDVSPEDLDKILFRNARQLLDRSQQSAAPVTPLAT
jgi:predicted TIM-barrel fold metal-dependent hydrolase